MTSIDLCAKMFVSGLIGALCCSLLATITREWDIFCTICEVLVVASCVVAIGAGIGLIWLI